MRGAAMSLTAAATGFVVFLLSVPVIQGQDGWGVTYTSTQICALKGSTVDISCNYTYPSNYDQIQTRFWFTKQTNKGPVDLETDSDYTGRVEYNCHDDNNCTLRIRDLRESDAAEYKFRFIINQPGGKYSGSPGVTLSVTDLQVQVKGSWNQLELKCHSQCNVADHPSYVWYNNEQKRSEETAAIRVSVNSNSHYSCAVKGHEEQRSAAVYAPKLPSVSGSPSAEIVEGSSVTLTCSSDANPAATYNWYKKSGNRNLNPTRRKTQLVFRSIQSSDSGEYYCMAGNKLGSRTSKSISINVKYAPRLPSVSVSPSAEIVEGSSVTLTCSSDANPAATYSWYKKSGNRNLNPTRRKTQLVLSSIQSSDSGEYYCTAENKLGRSTSKYTVFYVEYAPKLPSVSVSPSAEIVEGSSVTLTCSSDANPAATYSWYKKSGNRNLNPTSRKTQLVLSSIQSSDSGEYYCTAGNKLGRSTSKYTVIDVKYAPRLPSVSVSPSAEIVEGSSVTLTCSSDANPAANITWYKKSGSPDLSLSEQTQHAPQLLLSSIQSFDSGEYYCTAKNRLNEATSQTVFINVKYAPKLPSVSVSPSAEIVEGSSVTLTCSSDANPAANITWYKENQTLPQRHGGSYHFTSISSEDRGIYYCKSENQHGSITSSSLSVDVQYPPRLPSVSVSPSAEIVEGSSVTLTCSSDANPAANITWHKENEDSAKASGQIFTITDFRAEHSGNYSCEAQNSRGRHNSTLHLTVVAGAWKLKAAVTVPAISLAIILMSAFLLIIKKRSSKQASEPVETPDDMIECPQIHPAERQDPSDIHYANVHFAKKAAQPQEHELHYATVDFSKKPTRPRRSKEESVVYASVKFNSARPTARSQEAAEDPMELYSTVNKKRNL
ncbi:B-cell receptor CD22-like [Centropristis striata]|uniref:B-cell receptor CD22-like n=1 Tax=Centropristis striata TaxID=184440 RepID=UPI0027E066FD|nr:B-cell receptor CD22-like [Centropristis striata]